MKNKALILLVALIMAAIMPYQAMAAETLPQTIKSEKSWVLKLPAPLKEKDNLFVKWSSKGTYNQGKLKINGVSTYNYPITANTTVSEKIPISTATSTNVLIGNDTLTFTTQGYMESTILEVAVNGVPVDNREIDYIEPTKLQGTPTEKSVSLTWEKAADNPYYIKTNIYRDGVLIGESTSVMFEDSSVKAVTNYTYKITAVYSDGTETNGISLSLKTKPIPVNYEEVSNLQGEANYKSVNLTWENPVGNIYFSKVNVYREGLLVGSTEGSSFEDTNAKEGTEYRYLIKAVYTDGKETIGSTIILKTKIDVPPKIEGGGFEGQPNGDYLVKWDEPTTGKIIVYVGGSKYAEVDASAKQFVIPGPDVKYTPFGDPDIKLQPVSESGKPGEMEEAPKPQQPTNPLSTKDLVETGNGLLWYVAPLLLLALSFLLVPKLRALIVNSFRNDQKGVAEGKEVKEGRFRRFRNEASERREKEAAERKERKEQHQGKQYLERMDRLERERIESDERTSRTREAREREVKIATEARVKETAFRMRAERRRKQERIVREPRTLRAPREGNRAPREQRQRRG
ncbi:hypothetical protein V4V35_25410 [Bacillus infantis]|uniref:hypothetical protein n=1 Tax=Bacillus infantis TaxID=324767 RepID=UPI002FBEF70B